jgi:hypothetical protein
VQELEFLPDDYLRARFDRRLGFIRSWLLLVLGLAMVLWSLQMGTWVRNAQAELLALQGTGNAMEADVEKAQMLKAEAVAHNRRLAALEGLAPRTSAAWILGELADVLPDEVLVQDARITSEGKGGSAQLRLGGWAATEEAVGRTVGALESSAAFTKAFLVESKGPSGGERGGRHFVVEATIAAPADARGGGAGQ